jgi:hypothetical protein
MGSPFSVRRVDPETVHGRRQASHGDQRVAAKRAELSVLVENT